MEFKSLKNIETSFRQLRLFGIAYLCVCTLLVGFSVWKAYSFAEAQREKIYVLDEGKSLMLALSQDLEQNRPVEAREHVKRFHELFFTLAPDKSAVVTYAKLSIIREKSVTERSLVTRGRLLNSTRSDNNPHGFIMEAFRVVENKDIRVYDR